MLNIQIKAERYKSENSRNVGTLNTNEEKHERHIRESNLARKELVNDQNCPNNDTMYKKVTIIFDLQKILPTQKLTSGVAYNKRQLRV